MGGPDLAYDADGLAQGSQQHARLAATCTSLARALTGIAVSAAAFGEVPAATGFHVSALFVRDRQADDVTAEATRRSDLAARAAAAGGMGAALTTDTTGIARSAAPGSPRVPGGR